MTMQNPERVVTKQDLKDFYDQIYPYLGGSSSSGVSETMVAPVEADATSSSKAYAIGEQLILDGTLYKATAAISIGDALTVGTNIALADDLTTQIDSKADSSDITGKADKVTSATNGNFAGLDANGNLTDSGSKASDFLTQHQDITGKADKVANATNGNFAGLDANGNLTDSGKSASAISPEKVFYGTCNTTGSTAAKVVTCSEFTSSDLVSGSVIFVKFVELNSATPITLNVNSTGAKTVYRYGTESGSMGIYTWRASQVVPFVYDGSNWQMIWPRDASTSYAGVVQLSSSTSSTSTTLAATASAVKSAYDLANGKSTVSVANSGTASSTGVRKQQITVNSTSYDVNGSLYMEQSVTLSTSGTVSATFTNAAILSTSMIDVATNVFGVDPSDVSASSGSCTVTFPQADSAQTISCRIYIK